jgi:hypothetical protein
MLEKRLRLTVEFKVTVGEITREFVENLYRNTLNQDLTGGSLTWEIAARENRLLQALLRDREALDRFLAYVVLGEVDPAGGSRLQKLLGVGREDEVLRPVIRSLEGEDAEFFKGVIEEGMIQENPQLFEYSVSVEWLRARLTEIRVVAEGAGERGNQEVGVGDE